jgi:4-hydroxybenzoate polyprenyltransferase
MTPRLTIHPSRRIMRPRPRSRVARWWPIALGAVFYIIAIAVALALQGLP